jgi:hypothetical protein
MRKDGQFIASVVHEDMQKEEQNQTIAAFRANDRLFYHK